MRTLDEIKHTVEGLSRFEREALSKWIQQLSDTEGPLSGIAEPAAEYSDIEPQFMTLEDYVAFEERSPVRHEYLNGVLYAMSGASLLHYRITEAFVSAFRAHSSGGPCEVFSHQVQLRM